MNDEANTDDLMDDALDVLATDDDLAALGEESEAEESDEQGEQEAEAEQPKYIVKVNGEDVEVTLDELRNGYSRQADYTRKAQALADERKQLASLQASAVRESDETAKMRAVLLGLDHKLTQYDGVDWTTRDPVEFMQMTQAREIRAKLAQELQTKEQSELASIQAIRAAELEQARETLAKVLPDFETIKPKLLKAGVDYGLKEQELHSIVDPRLLVILRDAMNWKSYQTALAAKKPVAVAKPSVAPINGRRSAPASQGFNADAYLKGIL